MGSPVFARSTTINGDPAAIDRGITYVHDEVMPLVTGIDGCIGLSMMVDRQAGQCIVTTSWETEEAMRASEERLAEQRQRGAELLHGSPAVERWEIAVMHRDHAAPDGACCRATWLRTNHGHDVDRGIDIFRMALLPRLEALTGFCSASLFVNRELARACVTTTFDSRDAMETSRDEAWAIRDMGVRDAGVDVLDVAEYELAMAHLRVPELA